MDPNLLSEALDALIAGDDAKCAEILKGLLVSAATDADSVAPPADDALAQSPDAPPDVAPADDAPADPSKKEAVAALAALTKLSGCANLGESVAYVTKLKADADAVIEQAAVLEESSRVALVADLVKLGVELPATAWAGEPKDRKPVARLRSEPIAELRARVTAHKAAKGVAPKRIEAPPSGAVQLSADDQATADKIADPAKKAKFIALRTKYTNKGTEK